MAIEPRRKCGYRQVGGLYLCGDFSGNPCDRLPMLLEVCPACGQGIHPTRVPIEINPYRVFGPHEQAKVEVYRYSAEKEQESGPLTAWDRKDKLECLDAVRPCLVCDPPDDVAYVMGVGERFYHTPADFLEEAHRLGISKRLPNNLPKNFIVGKTIMYLAHPKAVEVEVPAVLHEAEEIVGRGSLQQKLVHTPTIEWRPGIICAFVPQRLEKIVTQSEAIPEYMEKLEKKGIRPVIVPDDDPDHQ